MGVDADHDADELLDLPGVPAGLAARRLREYRPGDNGQPVERTHRRGLRKVTRVELVHTDSVVAIELDDGEERWVLDATRRRWSTIQGRYGEHAMARAVELVHAGAVRLICQVDERMQVSTPIPQRTSFVVSFTTARVRSPRRTSRTPNPATTSPTSCGALVSAMRCSRRLECGARHGSA
jgi:hypothetical protein